MTSSIVGAITGALLAGPAAERIGPRRVLLITVLGVALVLTATGVSGAPACCGWRYRWSAPRSAR